MPFFERKKFKLPHSGPWIGIVTNHLDPTYMGSLEVALLKDTTAETQLQNETVTVRYLSPFYGVSSVKFEGNNSSDYQDVQKAYGMWFVPPDIGTQVLCIFIDGDPNSGFWMGCVADTFQNHSVPGFAASTNVAITPDQERKYGTRNLPVGEFLKGSRDISNSKPNTFTKPIHPFADRLLAQGLLTDSVRGVTSSSARREVPSSVFGISTPGPIDKNSRKVSVGYESKVMMPISRTGGSSFVMDDGDENGENELVRIRTRTGHQILLHNSHDLIYIANSKGTAWIELTSNGKIDIYAKDSVSIHTEQDFNFRADRDINIEAGRNLKIAVGASMQTDVAVDYTLIVNKDGRVIFNGNLDHTVDLESKSTVGGSLHVGVGKDIFQTSVKDFNIRAGNKLFQTSVSDMHIKTLANMFQESTDNFDLNAGGEYKESASKIDMNGPPAAIASSSIAAKSAEIPSELPKYNLPNRNKEAGWDDSKFYKAEDLVSIMKRVPTHEPWDHHESVDTARFNATATDSANAAPAKSQNRRDSTSETVKQGATANTPPPATPELNRGDMPAVWTDDVPFINKVKELAQELKCSHIDLLACMSFETGKTFSPSVKNPNGSATGLIQFIETTARSLGTSTAELARMTRVGQTDFVRNYFLTGPVRKVSNPTIEDLYMAILWPAAVGRPNDFVLFTDPGEDRAPRNVQGRRIDAYWVNRGLDKNKDGRITKAEAAAKVREHLNYVRTSLLKVPDVGGVWTDSSGNPILDGSGNPVRYGPFPAE
jgi:hypothetical protein